MLLHLSTIKNHQRYIQTAARMGLIVLGAILAVSQAHAARVKKVGTKGFTSSAVCGNCHKDIFATWKNSMHALSIDDPVFHAAYLESYLETRGEAKKTCMRCHAPATQVSTDFDLTEPISREGVTCDFCHSVTGVTPGAGTPFTLETGWVKGGPLVKAGTSAHGVRYSEVFERSTLCAGCHEYTNLNGVEVLGTYSEWMESPQAREGIPCQSCHMPRMTGDIASAGGKEAPEKYVNTHGVAGGHSLSQLKKALKVVLSDVRREGDKVSALVSVTNVGSGHAIPTGLPSRRLILTVEARNAQQLIYRDQRVFQKVVLDGGGKNVTMDGDCFLDGAKIAQDTRIKPGETRRESFAFSAPESANLDITARVTYSYEPPVLQRGEINADVAGDEKALGTR